MAGVENSASRTSSVQRLTTAPPWTSSSGTHRTSASENGSNNQDQPRAVPTTAPASADTVVVATGVNPTVKVISTFLRTSAEVEAIENVALPLVATVDAADLLHLVRLDSPRIALSALENS